MKTLSLMSKANFNESPKSSVSMSSPRLMSYCTRRNTRRKWLPIQPLFQLNFLAPPPTDKADNDRLFHDAPHQTGASFPGVVKHPISIAENAFNSAGGAKIAATTYNQVVAHGADSRLVLAYDELVNAESEKDRTNAANNLEKLKKLRQDSFVR